ncbi:Sua5/YciO/YrdC/YwlC family protein, partial [Ruminococcus flavefaciens]
MDTVLLSDNEADLLKAAELIKNGEIVGIPTETVYGLGADAS